MNTPPAEAGGFGLRLEAGSVGHPSDCGSRTRCVTLLHPYPSRHPREGGDPGDAPPASVHHAPLSWIPGLRFAAPGMTMEKTTTTKAPSINFAHKPSDPSPKGEGFTDPLSGTLKQYIAVFKSLPMRRSGPFAASHRCTPASRPSPRMKTQSTEFKLVREPGSRSGHPRH